VTTDAGPSTTTMITDLLDLGVRMGREVLAALRSDQPATRSLQVIRRTAADAPLSGLMPAMQSCGCDIPPPCWMPRELGRVVSHGCPGAKASVRLLITNGGLGPRKMTVDATGAGSGQVSVDPPSLSLGTFETGSVTASVTIPEEGASATDVLLWVHGCRDHVLRWRVEVSDDGCSCLHEVDVEDAPDLIHHWYDHFYCARPCNDPGKGDHTHG
jgi:hypothetical protein